MKEVQPRMMKHNHLMAAATAVGIADGLVHWPITVLGLAVALPAGLISDLDTPTSSFGQRSGPLPYLIRAMGIQHRTLFHSVLFAALVASGVLWLGTAHHWPYTQVVALSAFAGIMAHPIADAFSASGVSIFWPVPVRVRFARMRVEGMTERTWVTLLMMVLAVGVTAYVGSRYGWGLF